MRVCYHVQSHRSPDQVLRLVAAIRRLSPPSVIHVSHDVRGEPLGAVEAELRRLGDVEVRLDPGGYGDFTHLDRYLACVDWLRSERLDADWLVNLTGQDYPVRPLAVCEAELASSGMDGFIEHWPALGPSSHWPGRQVRSRYWFHHRRVARLSPAATRRLRPVQAVNRVQPWVRVHVAYGLMVGHRAAPPLGELALHGGSAYASLSWAAVDYLRAELARRPELVAHFRRTLSPEEVIVQTVLASAGRFRLDPDPKRYVDFTGSRLNHPRTLTTSELPAALASAAHFARKVDLRTHPDVLDVLDAHLALSPP